MPTSSGPPLCTRVGVSGKYASAPKNAIVNRPLQTTTEGSPRRTFLPGHDDIDCNAERPTTRALQHTRRSG
jgi:hypothetical protein